MKGAHSMKRTLVLLALIATVAVASRPAQAGEIGQRMRWQRARIAQGVRSGQLTPREAHRLRMGERRIAWQRARFFANDGRLGPVERARLNRHLNRESGRIYALKHNRWHRWNS
jgi:hypothetical protein